MKLCNYYWLLSGMHSYATGERRPETQQCPSAATRYVCVDQEGPEHGVTHYVDLCDEHDVAVRELPGWRSSEPKAVIA